MKGFFFGSLWLPLLLACMMAVGAFQSQDGAVVSPSVDVRLPSTVRRGMELCAFSAGAYADASTLEGLKEIASTGTQWVLTSNPT